MDLVGAKTQGMDIKNHALHQEGLKVVRRHFTRDFPRLASTTTSKILYYDDLISFFYFLFSFTLSERDLQFVNLNTIQEFIDKKRLVPKANNMINVRNLLECGIISSAKEGVKLLALVRQE